MFYQFHQVLNNLLSLGFTHFMHMKHLKILITMRKKQNKTDMPRSQDFRTTNCCQNLDNLLQGNKDNTHIKICTLFQS